MKSGKDKTNVNIITQHNTPHHTMPRHFTCSLHMKLAMLSNMPLSSQICSFFPFITTSYPKLIFWSVPQMEFYTSYGGDVY